MVFNMLLLRIRQFVNVIAHISIMVLICVLKNVQMKTQLILEVVHVTDLLEYSIINVLLVVVKITLFVVKEKILFVKKNISKILK